MRKRIVSKKDIIWRSRFPLTTLPRSPGSGTSVKWARPALALLGVKCRLRGVAGPMAAGSTAKSNTSGMSAGVVPERLTRSMRPAICALVVSLNLSSLNTYPATLLLVFGSHNPLSGLVGLSGLGAVSS